VEYNIEAYQPENRDDGTVVNHYIINSDNDFHFSSVSIDGKDMFSYNSYEFKNILNYIIDKYSDKVDKFVAFLDIGEAFLSTSLYFIRESHPYVDLIIDVFKKRKLLDRLVWRSNGLNPDFKFGIKFEPISSFLGMNIHTCFDIEPRKFSHIFLSLYRAYRPIREEFHNFLRDMNILEKSLYSYNAEGLKGEPYTNHYSVSLEDKSITAPMIMFPGNYFRNTFCSIVYESFWDRKVVFFTEKINKCLLTGHPFIVVASPKYLNYLKKLGFKTFDKWWDESYDNIIDENKRKQKIKENILEISKWDIKKCEKIYTEMIPILKHNQDVLKKIASKRNNSGYYLIKYKTSII